MALGYGRTGSNNFNSQKFIVDSAGIQNGATHTTITAATASAASSDTIHIRPGTYTENFTAKAGVHYQSDGNCAYDGLTIINGKVTVDGAGSFAFENIRFTTNSDYFLEQTAGTVNFTTCYFNCADNTGISCTGGTVRAYNCMGNLGTTGIGLGVFSTASECTFTDCNISNSGSSVTTTTTDEGVLAFVRCLVSIPLASSTTGSINFYWTRVNTAATNTLCIDQSGSTQSFSFYSVFESGTAAAISVGASGVFTCRGQNQITSSNATPVGGAGRIDISNMSFPNGTTNVVGTTTVNQGFINTGAISFDKGTNNLDDYEEGTWTPVIYGQSTAGLGTYTIQVGTYTKIGNRVIFSARVAWSAHTGTGDINISGLPFTSSNVTNNFSVCPLWVNSLTFTGTVLSCYVNVNASTLKINQASSGGAAAGITMDTNADIMFAGHFQTDS